MKGLEVSVTPISKVLSSTSTKRFDPEYFQKKHLADAKHASGEHRRFAKLSDLGIDVDASAFYPSIEGYYGQGNFPFYRVGDVNSIVDVEGATTIPETLCRDYPTLKSVSKGDLLFTKGGAIDRAGYVVTPGAVSRDLIFLRTSQLPTNEQLFLFAYFRTGFFRRMLLRSSSQTAQPHLTITLVRELPIFRGSESLTNAVGAAILSSYHHADQALAAQKEAERTLLMELGLADWTPPSPLSYNARASDVIAAGRADAQYFRPLFAEVEQRLVGTGRAIELGTILATNARGRQPQYDDVGLPVINSKHVRTNRVVFDKSRFASEAGSAVVIEKGDVLLNGTGVGTIGRAAPYLHDQRALPDNHVTVLRTAHVDPIYLAVFLNSPLGQWQIERRIKGSSGQIELYPTDIAKIVFWDAPKDIQLRVRDAIQHAFDEERKSQGLLDAAMRAVEIAIEDGDTAALEFINHAESTR